MSDLIDYGELYKSLDETAREIMIEHFGFPKSIMPCCANCEYCNGGVHCIRELGAVSDDNNFCILYKPCCSTPHKDNNSGILTSDLRDFVNEYESDHNVHLYSEIVSTQYDSPGLNIYMFDDDYYETKMCVGCFISDEMFEFIWNIKNGMSGISLLEKYIKLVFDELYYHLYHDECGALAKDLPYIYVIMYSFFAYYDYTSYPKQIKYEIQKVNNIGIKK